MKFNELLVTPFDFAIESCIEGAAFGVKTSCELCSSYFNKCLRTALLRLLYQYQDTLEDYLGYNLTTQYHEEEVIWDGSTPTVQLKHRGVIALNVKQVATPITGYGPFGISPYIVVAAVEDSGQGFCYVDVPVEFVDDPDKLSFWNSNNQQLVTQSVAGYPRIVDDKWQIPLGKPGTPTCLAYGTVNVQHCDYMVLEVAPTVACDNVFPVYPGTNDKIPVFKIEEQGSGNLRYWFYAWTLGQTGFYKLIDLSKGEFYKLFQTIEFKCFEDVEALPIVTELKYNCSGNTITTNSDLALTLLYSESGTILVSDSVSSCDSSPIKFKVFYKTSPDAFIEPEKILKAKEALVYLVAAELPVSTCQCGNDVPFIQAAQLPYDNIRVNQFTGAEIISQRYGESFGRAKYTSIIFGIKRKPRGLEL